MPKPPDPLTGALLRAPIAGALVLALAACGDASTSEPDTPPPPDAGAEPVAVETSTGWPVTPPPALPELRHGAESLDEPLLDQAERERIAQIEHRALVLSSRSFKGLAEALVARDAAALRHALADDFAGVGLVAGQTRRIEPAWTSEMSRADHTGAETFEVDADGFVDYLLGLRGKFGDDCRVGFAVRGLAPERDDELDGAWAGGCRLRLVGERGPGEPAETVVELEFRAARIPPSDAARGAPAWLSRCRVLELAEGWARKPLMEEVARERGFAIDRLHDNWKSEIVRAVTGGVFVADLDDDGRLDVLVTDVTGLQLYRGLAGGRFEDVTEASRLPPGLPDACALLADLDGDARVDIVVGDRVFANAGDMRFIDVSSSAFLPLQGAIGATVADYDLDGRIDVYATYTYAMSGRRRTTWFAGAAGPGNQLWANRGKWGFESVAPRVGAMAGKRSSFASAWLDANVDGRPDVYVANEFGHGVLLLNQPNGTFREHYLEGDDGDFGTMGLAVGDYDNDGFVDIFTANMYSKAGRRIIDNLAKDTYEPEVLRSIKRFITGSELYRNVGDGSFERRGGACRIKDVGWSYGASFVDLDNDGFLDLYATAGFVSRNRDEPDG